MLRQFAEMWMLNNIAGKAQGRDGPVTLLFAAQLDTLQQELSGAKERLLAKRRGKGSSKAA